MNERFPETYAIFEIPASGSSPPVIYSSAFQKRRQCFGKSDGLEQLQAQQQTLHEYRHASSDLIFQKDCPLSLSSVDGPLLNIHWLTVYLSLLKVLNLKHQLGHIPPAKAYCCGKAYEAAGTVS